MDLAALQKKSILVPTPGQTEQEYLAKHLMQNNFAFCVEQKKFRLKNILALAESFPYQPFPAMHNKLNVVVGNFVEGIKSKKSKAAVKSAKSF
jgi:UDP-N-acetylglucosamine:LPS N-acetylglucosamine transferase